MPKWSKVAAILSAGFQIYLGEISRKVTKWAEREKEEVISYIFEKRVICFEIH